MLEKREAPAICDDVILTEGQLLSIPCAGGEEMCSSLLSFVDDVILKV
jgi:hypothetical protein